jgi:hypothetical protein
MEVFRLCDFESLDAVGIDLHEAEDRSEPYGFIGEEGRDPCELFVDVDPHDNLELHFVVWGSVWSTKGVGRFSGKSFSRVWP